jgi:hypothetical protein
VFLPFHSFGFFLEVPSIKNSSIFPKGDYKLGEFIMLKVEDCTSATLKGSVIGYSDNN